MRKKKRDEYSINLVCLWISGFSVKTTLLLLTLATYANSLLEKDEFKLQSFNRCARIFFQSKLVIIRQRSDMSYFRYQPFQKIKKG